MSDVQSILIQAIKNRKEIKFTYDKPGDFAKGLRIGLPHALYFTKSTQKTKVDVYQVSGDSTDRSSIPGWKPFDLDYIRSIEISEKTFNIQHGYNSSSSRYFDYIEKL